MPNQEQVKRFIEALRDAGFIPTAYSGRSMFGKQCVSVSTDEDSEDVSAWNVARALWYQTDEDEELNIPEPRQDSLGLGIVLYWPSYEWPQGE